MQRLKANAEQNLKKRQGAFESYLQGVFENQRIVGEKKWVIYVMILLEVHLEEVLEIQFSIKKVMWCMSKNYAIRPF
jgi:hypothetical protein